MNPEGLPFFINPSVLRTPPLYFAVQNTGEEGEMYFSFAFAPILYATPHKVTGHGRGRRLNANDFLSQPKKVLVTLIHFVCSFFSTARRTNQEGLPQLSGACLYSNPPLLLSLRVFLTPPSFGHLPYILLCKTQRRRVRVTFRSLQIQ